MKYFLGLIACILVWIFLISPAINWTFNRDVTMVSWRGKDRNYYTLFYEGRSKKVFLKGLDGKRRLTEFVRKKESNCKFIDKNQKCYKESELIDKFKKSY